MDEKEIQEVVSNAIEKVITEDNDLLRFNVNERSITHRLAVYLEELINGKWNVDVEYNRAGEDSVKKTVPVEYFKSQISENTDPTDLDAKSVYPDIIVHHRGELYDNLLAIEVKKLGGSGEYDQEKLTAYVEELDYQYGLFIKFLSNTDNKNADCKWYPFET